MAAGDDEVLANRKAGAERGGSTAEADNSNDRFVDDLDVGASYRLGYLGAGSDPRCGHVHNCGFIARIAYFVGGSCVSVAAASGEHEGDRQSEQHLGQVRNRPQFGRGTHWPKCMASRLGVTNGHRSRRRSMVLFVEE